MSHVWVSVDMNKYCVASRRELRNVSYMLHLISYHLYMLYLLFVSCVVGWCIEAVDLLTNWAKAQNIPTLQLQVTRCHHVHGACARACACACARIITHDIASHDMTWHSMIWHRMLLSCDDISGITWKRTYTTYFYDCWWRCKIWWVSVQICGMDRIMIHDVYNLIVSCTCILCIATTTTKTMDV
jgi:hypothetical protein